MVPRLTFGIALPQTFLDGPVDVPRLREFLVRADAGPFDGVWVLEPLLASLPSLGPVELLTYAAARTTRVRLGSAVLLTALQDPVHMAKTLTTIDHLSEGRLIVGVGLGSQAQIYPAFGLSPERRAERFSSGIRVMKRLWTEARVTADEPFCKLDGVAMEPKPVQRPHPPLWFGGHRPAALRRAVDLGDGFVGAGVASTAQFAEHVQGVRAALTERRRDPAGFAIGKRVYIAVADDRTQGLRRLAAWFQAFYGGPVLGNDRLETQVAVCGGPQECIDRLAEVVAAGARHLVLNPVFDELDQLERLAADVLPKLDGV